MKKLYQISFYVPGEYLEEVKRAVFNAGAGSVGRYDQCCWQTQGLGQFCPREGSTPHTGIINQLSEVPEYKVETVCSEEHLQNALSALIQAHPYETPAYFVIEMVHHIK